MLLGLWASGGETAFANEILALKAAIAQHGTQLANAVDGISVGSEDLYRSSPQGIAAGSNVGTSPEVVASYINRVREAIKGTALANAKIGHVSSCLREVSFLFYISISGMIKAQFPTNTTRLTQ